MASGQVPDPDQLIPPACFRFQQGDPGDSIWFGVEIEIEKAGTLIENSGDTGLPTEIEWTVPEGAMVELALSNSYFTNIKIRRCLPGKILLLSRLTLSADKEISETVSIDATCPPLFAMNQSSLRQGIGT